MRAPLLAMLLLIGAAAACAADRTVLYAAVGNELRLYRMFGDGSLERQGAAVTCPANIQYVWQHPSRKFLYAAWSDGGPGTALGAPTGGRQHGVTAYRIDGGTGMLSPHGDAAVLRTRPVHISVDPAGRHLLVAHTMPSEVTVHEIRADGTLGGEVAQKAAPAAGVYAHQVLADPRQPVAMLVSRGNLPAAGKREDPGAVQVYRYDSKTGALTNWKSVTPAASGGGFGFQPRHVDFHPTQPWVFLSVEGQNQLQMYRQTAEGMLEGPAWTVDSLLPETPRRGQQSAGAIHVHPNGRFVYQSNRRTSAGGENSIAVYGIDGATGKPARIRNVDTRGFSPRTFSVDPAGGRWMVVGNQVPVGDVAASLAVFRIADDGVPQFVRKYDLPEATNARSLFWVGFLLLP